jgi:hypothetical protein
MLDRDGALSGLFDIFDMFDMFDTFYNGSCLISPDRDFCVVWLAYGPFVQMESKTRQTRSEARSPDAQSQNVRFRVKAFMRRGTTR